MPFKNGRSFVKYESQWLEKSCSHFPSTYFPFSHHQTPWHKENMYSWFILCCRFTVEAENVPQHAGKQQAAHVWALCFNHYEVC